MITISPVQIDREKVRKNIEKFIENKGNVSIYVEAPRENIAARYFYYKDRGIDPLKQVKRVIPTVVHDPKDYADARMSCEVNGRLFGTSWQLDLLFAKSHTIINLWEIWNYARQCEDHPEINRWGWKRLFSPSCWFRTPQEVFDKVYPKALSIAYDWLQEDRPLWQSDLKNKFAIQGITLLNDHNKSPKYPKKAPLDKFVAEQVARIPESAISSDKEVLFKWVRGDRVVPMDCTFRELYG